MSKKTQNVMALIVALIALKSQEVGANGIERHDFYVESESGVSLFVREVRPNTSCNGDSTPILLVHGARVPGIASFDLQVANGSLAADLARAGYPVYVMDVRGYGYSTRIAGMSKSPDANAPLVRSPAVVHDIDAVVDWIRERLPAEKVALLGWATGGNWSGYYATLQPDKVSHLVLYNTLYGGSEHHPRIGHGTSLEDPANSGQFNYEEFGAYRFNTADSLFRLWDRSIELEDKTDWRDQDVAAAYAAAAMASDFTSETRTPPSFRAPTGALEDSFYLATGRQVWDASLIRASVLIISSEEDFWSRPEDRKNLVRHLSHAKEVESIIIPDATHYVHLDRPKRGRRQFIQEVLSFLGKR